MSIATTSRTAYESIIDKLGDRQEQVYEAIKALQTATNEQLSDYLHLPIQSVTGRSNELNRYGLIEVVGVTKTKSGRSAKVWSAKYPMMNFMQQDLFDECFE